MSVSHFTGELKPSPTAKRCQELLGDLNPVFEKRMGYVYIGALYFCLFAVLTIPIIYFGIFENPLIPRNFKPLVAPLVGAILLIFSLLGGSHEQRLYSRNEVNGILGFLHPLFNKDEKHLTICVGRKLDSHEPNWLSGTGPYCFFVFTSQRLIIITFNSSLIGINLINKCIQKNQLDTAIQGIYTCSLIDKDSFSLTDTIYSNATHLFYTMAKVQPINCDHAYTWLLDDKLTRGRKALKEIVSRTCNIN